MKFVEVPLRGAYIVQGEPIADERGYFLRIFCQNDFSTVGFTKHIVQVNQSRTIKKGTVRGMHYQVSPACETKIIRCVSGSVFDVMIDLRFSSPTFLKWYATELSEWNMKMVYIPEGFAHGFQALTDNVELLYHHSDFYNPQYERGIRFDDPMINIDWPLPVELVSPKDQSYHRIDSTFVGIEI